MNMAGSALALSFVKYLSCLLVKFFEENNEVIEIGGCGEAKLVSLLRLLRDVQFFVAGTGFVSLFVGVSSACEIRWTG